MSTSFLDRLFADPALDVVTPGQLATAICMGVRISPTPKGRELTSAIDQAEQEAESNCPPNQMQITLASELGIAIDKNTTRSMLCMEMLSFLHQDPESFATRPSAAFQDRFCGGPFSRFGEWLPKVETKTDPTIAAALHPLKAIFEFVVYAALICAPFVAIWWGVKALWRMLFG